MKYDVDKMLVCTICQKCPAKPTKVPLTNFLLPNGLLWIPEVLYCPGCGNYVTIQVREMTKDELKEREGIRKKEDAEDVAAAKVVLEGTPTEVTDVDELMENLQADDEVETKS